MKPVKPEKKNKAFLAAVGSSLLIHFAVGALLIWGLSDNGISPPKLNGINLVWVSLDSKSQSGGKIENVPARQPLPATARITEKQVNIEKPVLGPPAAQALSASGKESARPVILAKYDGSGAKAKDLPDNITGYGENKSAGKTSPANMVIAYPLYKENAPPVYPEIARVRGYEGIVLVFAEILPDGRVGEIKIRKSSGYAILDQSAIQAVKPWKFEPAKRSGNPFTAWVELPIKFILHHNGSQS